MTLVYERAVKGPATHVFAIGCGRFRIYRPDGSADRGATVAGARSITRFFLEQADNLIAPLASIECLISDPAVDQGADALGLGDFANDPRENDSVEPALSGLAKPVGDRWLDRCKPGDTMFFYMASHGFVDADYSALGAFEDLGAVQRRAWENAINVHNIANALPTTGAAGCFVFLDACQEIVTEVLEQYSGSNAIELFTSGLLRARARTSVRSAALAGARFGGKAWAPTDGSPPYFTQALLEGMSNCCVERVHGEGWVVSGRQLMGGIEDVADAALDYVGLETEALVGFKQKMNLLRVANPQIPVAVRTKVEGHINLATEVTADDGNGHLMTRNNAALTWQFRVPPNHNKYLARASFAGPPSTIRDREFYADAPAQIVTL